MAFEKKILLPLSRVLQNAATGMSYKNYKFPYLVDNFQCRKSTLGKSSSLSVPLNCIL